MARIWITGARGFIGRHLAKQLAGSGDSVYGIGFGQWPETEARRWGVDRWIAGAIEPANLNQLSQDGPPQHVYHLAGGSAVGPSIHAPLEDFSRSVATGAQLFDWMRQHVPQASVTLVSSAAVYGAGHAAGISTQAPLRPFSPYGHHKLMVEQLIHSYADCFGLRAVIVRLFSVYGPWLYKQLLWDICSKLTTGTDQLSIGGDGGELRDWTHVTDVTKILQQTAPLASTQIPILNAGSGVATPVREIIEKVIFAWESSADLSFSGFKREGNPYCLVSEPCRINETAFDWEVDIDHGIQEYVSWYKGQHA